MPKIKDIQSDFRYIRIKVPRSDFDKFNKLYQGLEQLSLTRAFYFMLNDPANFEKIFWSVRVPDACLPYKEC